MNILINNKCQGRCDYCFQKGWLNDPNIKDMTLPSFVKASKMLERLKVPVVGIAGGEPTLHPRFTEFLEMVCSMRFAFIVVLTNGLFADDGWIEWYGNVKQKETGMLFNVRSPQTYSEKEWELLNNNIEAAADVMAHNVAVGTTLNVGFSGGDVLRKLMINHNIFDLRISLSAPSYDYSNNFVRKHELKTMGKIVANIVRKSLDEKILTHIDCPIPACAFDEDDFYFVRRWADRFRYNCVMPPLDITPDLHIWYCSSMMGTGTDGMKLDDLELVGGLDKVYLEIERKLVNQGIRKQPLFTQCLTCERWNMCMGGCLKLKMQNRQKQPHIKPKEKRKGFFERLLKKIS